MTPQQIDRGGHGIWRRRAAAPAARRSARMRRGRNPEADSVRDPGRHDASGSASTPGGWKVGFSPEGGHFCAPIYASLIHSSPASLPARGFKLIGIECEIGFRRQPGAAAAGAALHARGSARRRLDAPDDRGPSIPAMPISARSTGCRCSPTISRTARWSTAQRLRLAGDGPGASADRGDLPTAKPSPIAPDCAPAIRSTCWWRLVNHVAGKRGGVPAGTFVTTGTHTGMVFTEPGVHIRADYGRLGVGRGLVPEIANKTPPPPIGAGGVIPGAPGSRYPQRSVFLHSGLSAAPNPGNDDEGSPGDEQRANAFRIGVLRPGGARHSLADCGAGADHRLARAGDPGGAAQHRIARPADAAASLGRVADPARDAVSCGMAIAPIRRRPCRRR